MMKQSVLNFLRRAAGLAAAVLGLALGAAGNAHAQAPAGYNLLCQEGERCVIGPWARDIAYGVGPSKIYKRPSVSGVFVCGEGGIFNGGDPAKGSKKSCYVSQQLSRISGCNVQDLYCNVASNTTVWYGVDGQYVSETRSGSFKCGDKFGDPWKGRRKFCFIANLW